MFQVDNCKLRSIGLLVGYEISWFLTLDDWNFLGKCLTEYTCSTPQWSCHTCCHVSRRRHVTVTDGSNLWVTSQCWSDAAVDILYSVVNNVWATVCWLHIQPPPSAFSYTTFLLKRFCILVIVKIGEAHTGTLKTCNTLHCNTFNSHDGIISSIDLQFSSVSK